MIDNEAANKYETKYNMQILDNTVLEQCHSHITNGCNKN